MEFLNDDLHIYISIFNFELFELEFSIFISELFLIILYPYRNFIQYFFSGNNIFFFQSHGGIILKYKNKIK